jgi:Ni,Fe-hydrogenase I small subunit
LKILDVNLLWHPFLSLEIGQEVEEIFNKCISGEIKVDVLIVFFLFNGRPYKEWIERLAMVSQNTIAIGTCAAFGGIVAAGANIIEAKGLQFLRREKGGVLGKDYVSGSGLPVVNVPGCPCHPDWIVETLMRLVMGKLGLQELDEFNRPKAFYKKLAHHGCPRNEFYEFKASAVEYGQQGCLFEYLGCKGTLCESDCNERMWLGRTGSCTRGGFPCIACTSMDFPDGSVPFFETRKIGEVPVTLPLDVPKAWYVGMANLSKLATPERLKKNAVSYKRVD